MKKFPKGDKNNGLWWVITIGMFLTGGLTIPAILLCIANAKGLLPPVSELIHWIVDLFRGDPGPERSASGQVDPTTGRVTWDEPKKAAPETEQARTQTASEADRLRADAQRAADELRRAAEQVRRKVGQSVDSTGRVREKVSESVRSATAPIPKTPGKKYKAKKAGGVRIGFGILLIAAGFLSIMFGISAFFSMFTGIGAFMDLSILGASLSNYLSLRPLGFVGGVMFGGVMLAAGIILTVFGTSAKKRAKAQDTRLRRLLQILGDGAELPIDAIASMAGRSYNQTVEDLEELIRRGYLENAWIDRAAGILRTGAPQGAATASEQEKEKAAETEAERILRKIRADNDLIDDEIISEKIDRIEDLTRKIFDFQRNNPEKADENRTFMNYYLPQTLKLLETYARLEASGADVANVTATKQKISEGLDKLILGFERHLDKLYSADVIDITAEIRVMEQMLEKDGLTEDRFAR